VSGSGPSALARRFALSVIAGLAMLVLLARAMPAHAVDPAQMPTAALEARYLALTHELRCVKCQNETLADSEVEIAAELRHQIRDMLLAGKSDDEIRNYMVSRYTEFILFKPRYSARNAWLWLSPLVLLVIGALVAARIVRARAALLAQDEAPVDDEPLASEPRAAK
jgi:cytochrome c-type biogenesis protein CcmH